MQKINVSLKAFDNLYLKKAFYEISKILFYLDANTHFATPNPATEPILMMQNFKLSNFSFISLPKTRTLFTVIRSPHIDKKSREQFELKKYKKQIIVTTCNLSLVSLILFFFKNCKFPGVEITFSVEYSTFLKV